MGTCGRLHRIVPPQGTVLCGERISPGVSVHTTALSKLGWHRRPKLTKVPGAGFFLSLHLQ